MFALTLILAGAVTEQEVQVVALIRQLGDERYAVRAAAHTRLGQVLASEVGPLYQPLVEAATRSPDLEAARRAVMLLEDFYSVRPTDYPVLPWIDMLDKLPVRCDDWKRVLDRTREGFRPAVGAGPTTDWSDYRFATYLYTSELLHQGYSRKYVRDLLDEMAKREIEYRQQRGMRAPGAD